MRLIMMFALLVFVVSCKTPGQKSQVSEGGAAGVDTPWGACDKTVEKLKEQGKKLVERLRDRLQLLRALVEIGPNLATAVTFESASVNGQELPSEIASRESLGSPDAPTEAGLTRVKNLQFVEVYAEIANIATDLSKQGSGAENQGLKAEASSELSSLAEELNESIKNEKDVNLRDQRLSARLLTAAALSIIDPKNPSALTPQMMKQIVDGISPNNREIAAIDIAHAATLLSAENNNSLKQISNLLNQQVQALASKSASAEISPAGYLAWVYGNVVDRVNKTCVAACSVGMQKIMTMYTDAMLKSNKTDRIAMEMAKQTSQRISVLQQRNAAEMVDYAEAREYRKSFAEVLKQSPAERIRERAGKGRR